MITGREKLEAHIIATLSNFVRADEAAMVGRYVLRQIEEFDEGCRIVSLEPPPGVDRIWHHAALAASPYVPQQKD